MTSPIFTPTPLWMLRRGLYISPAANAVYVNNAKVACTSIKRALQIAEAERTGALLPRNVHDRKKSPLLHRRNLTRKVIVHWLETAYVFSFVRHPLPRLQSAYLNKIVSGQKNGQHRVNLGFAADAVPEFADFLRAILAKAPAEHDAHWRPQHINLAVSDVIYDKIGHLETMAQDWTEIAGHCGLVDPAPREGRRTEKTDGPTLAAPDELLQDITDYFAPDFTLFGYRPDRPHPVRPAILDAVPADKTEKRKAAISPVSM